MNRRRKKQMGKFISLSELGRIKSPNSQQKKQQETYFKQNHVKKEKKSKNEKN
jgi:hypothetical protein